MFALFFSIHFRENMNVKLKDFGSYPISTCNIVATRNIRYVLTPARPGPPTVTCRLRQTPETCLSQLSRAAAGCGTGS